MSTPSDHKLTLVLAIGIPVALIAMLAALVGGFLLRGCLAPPKPMDDGMHTGHGEQTSPRMWTCSMHPQIQQPKPGLCPICNMELIPLESAGADEGPRVFSTSKSSRALMDIRTSKVERRYVQAKVQMVGKVDYDETRVGSITARFPGRLDRLYVDYTGIPVKKGDHMVYLYSPQLLAAQQELIGAKQAVDNARGSGGLIVDTATDTLEAVREKLRLWDLTPEQIADIEKKGKPSDHMTIYSPMGGIVIDKHVNEGAYVQTGQRIYTIADLSRLWVKLDAYESDLVWLRYGQKVTFTSEAYAGATFEGRIAFISPVLDEKTRTVKVRVNVDNRSHHLKPGMFVRAEVKATVASGGRVIDAALQGKFMCPMHPEIVKDDKGTCDLCGMPLESAESLGYVAVDDGDSFRPLVVPVTAPLVTGERAVVYVELPNKKKPTFEGREVVLGPRAGDWYIVRSGLQAGDLVVTQGAFKIDSALQLQAKPSMMMPPEDEPMGSNVIGARPAADATPKQLVPQKTCPIMGGKIDKKYYVDALGKRIYMCCPGCTDAIKNDPKAAIATLRERGEMVEDAPGAKPEMKPEPKPQVKPEPKTEVKTEPKPKPEPKPVLVPQKTCPIMGGKIDKKLYVDALGKRIYMCCPGCTDAIKKDPRKAIDTLRKRGEMVEDAPKPAKEEAKLVPQKTCPIMGGKIDKKFYVDALGKRIYMCCPGCTDAIKKDPKAAIETLRKRGEAVEDAPGKGGGK